MSDLVKRLREHIAVVFDDRGHVFENELLCDQAADRIEELEAKLRASAMQELAALGQAQNAHEAQLAAEAKLAKAVEALDEAVYLLDPDDEDIAKETGLHRIVTTLAALKEDTT